MAAFEYRQAEEVRDAFARHGVRYLFIGKSAAILLGFPDTTQDADLFVEKTPDNGRAITRALRELGFALEDSQAAGAPLDRALARPRRGARGNNQQGGKGQKQPRHRAKVSQHDHDL